MQWQIEYKDVTIALIPTIDPLYYVDDWIADLSFQILRITV